MNIICAWNGPHGKKLSAKNNYYYQESDTAATCTYTLHTLAKLAC